MDQPSENEQRRGAKAGAITIKKYANRRLYNTATSCYVTLDYLSQLVKTGAEFIVYDAKTGEDITRSVLTHIIVEEEAKGHSLLPVSFLRHLISFYGDSLQVLVPRYLEQVMHAFAINQQNMRDGMRDTFDGLMPFGRFEDMSKQQMALLSAPCGCSPHSSGKKRQTRERARLSTLRQQKTRLKNSEDASRTSRKNWMSWRFNGRRSPSTKRRLHVGRRRRCENPARCGSVQRQQPLHVEGNQEPVVLAVDAGRDLGPRRGEA